MREDRKWQMEEQAFENDVLPDAHSPVRRGDDSYYDKPEQRQVQRNSTSFRACRFSFISDATSCPRMLYTFSDTDPEPPTSNLILVLELNGFGWFWCNANLSGGSFKPGSTPTVVQIEVAVPPEPIVGEGVVTVDVGVVTAAVCRVNDGTGKVIVCPADDPLELHLGHGFPCPSRSAQNKEDASENHCFLK